MEHDRNFLGLKGTLCCFPQNIFKLLPWQQNRNHKSLVGTYPLDLPETIVTLLPSCAHPTTKMTSPPADARNHNRNPLNLRTKIFPAIDRERNIRKCCEKLEGTIAYQPRVIQRLKTQLDALVNENKLLDKG